MFSCAYVKRSVIQSQRFKDAFLIEILEGLSRDHLQDQAHDWETDMVNELSAGLKVQGQFSQGVRGGGCRSLEGLANQVVSLTILPNSTR